MHFPTLDRSIRTDVLIIGGGLCGLLCAYLLRQAGLDCVLLEAETLCSGMTKHTTAKLTVQHGLIYQDLIRTFGLEAAKQYLLANEAALDRYRLLCGAIDCGFETRDSYVYARSSRRRLEQEAAALHALGRPAELCASTPLPFPVKGAIRLANQAQFDPLQFAAAISRGLPIYAHSRVRELIGTRAITDHGVVQARRILITTHFPFLNKHGLYFLKLYQHRSYVIALKNAQQVNGMYVDEAQNGLSFRNHRELLLIGGGDHRTGKQGGGWRELRAFAARCYPQAAECAHWAAQDCMSLDGVPYIGAYARGAQDLYVATGFNKWGMTSSMVAAMLLSDQLQGIENPCRGVFSPSRSILRPQLAANLWESAVDLLTPTAKRCPHLGCALKWNPCERTWDCPCHGSRFTEDGRLIDNPATGDLKRRNAT